MKKSEMKQEVQALGAIQSALCDDVERLHQHVDMWGSTPLKTRVADLEASMRLVGEIILKLVENEVAEDEDEDEDDWLGTPVVSIFDDFEDEALTIVRVGDDQELVLDPVEFEKLRRCLNDFAGAQPYG